MNQYHRVAKIITSVEVHEVPQLHRTDFNKFDLSNMIVLPDHTIFPEHFAKHKIINIERICNYLPSISKDLYLAWSPQVEEAIGIPLSIMNELQVTNNNLVKENATLKNQNEIFTKASLLTRVKFLFTGKC